ncbi:hypothetical protein TWF481_001374 [Arthrobotrys musiformis]|uniref:Uncharacterized protein n=1 Tax=Arthrobotrys musiformis TaxID=47236 RepID=A0AAV9WQE3_9PEZI
MSEYYSAYTTWYEMSRSHPSFAVWLENADEIRSSLTERKVPWTMIFVGIADVGGRQMPGIKIHIKRDKDGNLPPSFDHTKVVEFLREELVPDEFFQVIAFK